MLNKKGQLTIFIIIAILIIAIIGLFFMFRGGLQIPGKPVSPETAQIQNFVQECLDESLEDVVFRVGEGGGYYFPPKISTPILEVPYYIKKNKNLMPSKEKVQDEISRYTERELFLCLGNFALFPEYEITKKEIILKTIIEPERVIVDVNYPLIIKKGESISKIDDFSSEVPVRLGIVYDAVGEFIEEDLIIEGECASCLLKVLGENDLYSNSFDYDNKTRIFIIRDYNSKINGEEFVYNFANEY